MTSTRSPKRPHRRGPMAVGQDPLLIPKASQLLRGRRRQRGLALGCLGPLQKMVFFFLFKKNAFACLQKDLVASHLCLL